MSRIGLFVMVLLGWCIPLVVPAQEMPVIPYPQSVVWKNGEIALENGRIGCIESEFWPEALLLKEKLENVFSETKLSRKERKASIVLKRLSGLQGNEAYRIEVEPERVVIGAGERAGIFYGIQTFLQLLNNEGKQLKCCVIEDAPRYGWRGYMLDESRHFFGKEKVKRLLEDMAYYKLNKFHWHLTDEPGWRIEIKKYPRLTSIGGRGNWSDPDNTEVRFYTQDEIREIVAYASKLHIEVIPEIDMPGHATAANNAYPEYSGGGTAEHPDFTFNVGKEEVYAFLTDVLREVADLFPSSYLHIGGDEVAFGTKAWGSDPAIQAMMKREGLKNLKEAEGYFIHRMADSVRTLGKTLVGWDELLEVDIPKDRTVIMWWRHDRVNQLKKSLSGGYPTVMCPRRPLYFDFIQHKDHKWGRVWSGFCPLEDVYAFPDKGMASWQLPKEQLQYIQGIQANLWVERVHNTKRLDFMTYPRLCALAESGWTLPENKNYEGFIRRMEHAYRDFDRKGIYYFDARQPSAHPEPVGPQRQKRNVPMDFRD